MRAGRELKPVASRGRPEKQCEHCRNARKSRSHHAKCDCGEKKEKVVGYANDDSTSAALHAVEHYCCCIHGEQCICGMKKGAGSKVAQHTLKSKLNFSVTIAGEHADSHCRWLSPALPYAEQRCSYFRPPVPSFTTPKAT